MGRTMDQKRAAFALQQIDLINTEEGAKTIQTESARFIALIFNSGFLQAMDYAKNKFPETYRCLAEWFKEDNGPVLPRAIQEAVKEEKLNEALANMDNSYEYRQVMQEAVEFLGWLKSKAEGKKMELQSKKQPSLEDKET